MTSELTAKVQQLENELRLTKSRSQISSDELSRVRTQLIEKDKRANELASQAGQFNSIKSRCEQYSKEIENLRNKQREDQSKHKEEMQVLRKETMRIRQLESEIKNLTRHKEKSEEQATQHLKIASTKLEKEHENCLKLVDQLKQAEARAKEFQSAASRITEIETERNELVKKVRGHKSDLATVKEESQRDLKMMQAEFIQKISSYERIEIEFASYKKTVSVKLSQFEQLDEDVYRLKAEIEELQLRNERMQKRLAEKEQEIK